MPTVALWAEIKNYANVTVKVELVKVAGGTTPIEVSYSRQLSLHYVGEDTEYKPIRQRKLTWKFSAPTQVVLDVLYDVFVQEEGAYLIYFYEAGVQKYTGVALVDQYEETDKAFPVQCEVFASDTAMLKNLTTTTTGGKKTLITILQTELDKLGYSLPFRIVNEYKPSGLGAGDANDSFLNVQYNPLTHYDVENQETDDSYDAVEQLLKSHLIEIFQKDNEWWLMQITEMHRTPIRQKLLNSAGVYQSGQAINPRVSVSSLLRHVHEGTKYKNRGYKSSVGFYEYGEIASTLITNPEFDDGSTGWSLFGGYTGPLLPMAGALRMAARQATLPSTINLAQEDTPGGGLKQTSGTIVVQAGVNTRLQVSIKGRFSYPVIQVPGLSNPPPWALYVKVKVGAANYLTSWGGWQTTPNVFCVFSNFLMPQGAEALLSAEPLPSGGALEVQFGALIYNNPLIDWGFIADSFRIDVIEGDGEPKLVRVFNARSTKKTADEFEMETTKMGDGPTSSHHGAIYYAGLATSVWTSGLDAVGRLLHEMNAMNFMRLFGNPREKYDLSFIGQLDPSNVFLRNSVPYRILDADWDAIKNEVKAFMVQAADDAAISVTFRTTDESNKLGISGGRSSVLSGSIPAPESSPRIGQQDGGPGNVTVTFSEALASTNYDPIIEGWALSAGAETGNKIAVKLVSKSTTGLVVYVAVNCRIRFNCQMYR